MNQLEGADSANRRAQIEGVLARYPEVDNDDLQQLQHWFRKEATALDVGLIASDPALAKSYREFAAEHIEPLSGADLLRASLFVALLLALIAAVALLSF